MKDWNDLVLGPVLRQGTASFVCAGTTGGRSVLVTLTADHSPPASRATYELPLPGIAPLVWIGRPSYLKFDDTLVEAVPDGAVAAATVTLGEPVLAALGARVAEVAAAAHDAGVVIDGIQPDLIYVDVNHAFAALLPRGPRFIASARRVASGIGAYKVPYIGYECLALGRPSGPPSDVFAVCASLFVLATGRHPFGALDDLGEILHRTMADAREPLAGPLGDVLAMGLVADPAARPTMRELRGHFERAFATA